MCCSGRAGETVVLNRGHGLFASPGEIFSLLHVPLGTPVIVIGLEGKNSYGWQTAHVVCPDGQVGFMYVDEQSLRSLML